MVIIRQKKSSMREWKRMNIVDECSDDQSSDKRSLSWSVTWQKTTNELMVFHVLCRRDINNMLVCKSNLTEAYFWYKRQWHWFITTNHSLIMFRLIQFSGNIDHNISCILLWLSVIIQSQNIYKIPIKHGKLFLFNRDYSSIKLK